MSRTNRPAKRKPRRTEMVATRLTRSELAQVKRHARPGELLGELMRRLLLEATDGTHRVSIGPNDEAVAWDDAADDESGAWDAHVGDDVD